MKAQKLGLVLGMNMAVACMVMQGCKAVKPGQETPPPAGPAEVVAMPSEPVAPASQTSTISVTPVAETPEASRPAAAPRPSAPVVSSRPVPPPPPPPPPSQVAVVKPLTPPPPKPVAVKPVAAVSATPAPASISHVVSRGDSLSGISRRYNVKMSAIVAANPGLNPDRIKIGQKIAIPGSAPASAAVAAAPVAKKDANVMQAAAPAPVAANVTAPIKTKTSFKPYEGATKEYVVRNGDSLGKIAVESGITIRALKALNGLQKDNVRVGQKLLVPAEKVVAGKPAPKAEVKPAAEKAPAVAAPAKPVEKKAPEAAPKAEVKPAAPVAAAEASAKPEAKDAGASIAALAEAPAPSATVQAPVEEKKPEVVAPAPAPAAEGPTYTAKEGDDVVSVAISWGISPSQLIDLNDLKPGDPIKPGQVLKLPANAKQTNP